MLSAGAEETWVNLRTGVPPLKATATWMTQDLHSRISGPTMYRQGFAALICGGCLFVFKEKYCDTLCASSIVHMPLSLKFS